MFSLFIHVNITITCILLLFRPAKFYSPPLISYSHILFKSLSVHVVLTLMLYNNSDLIALLTCHIIPLTLFEFVLNLMEICVIENFHQYLKTVIQVLMLLTCIWNLRVNSNSGHSEQNKNGALEWWELLEYEWYDSLN